MEMNGKCSPYWKTIFRRNVSWKKHAALRIVAPRPFRERLTIPATGVSMEKRYNVLFLCTGNSARSIIAEAILNRKGRPAFSAFSAGSHPAGRVRPEALQQIELSGMSTEGLQSKSWDEFAKAGAPQMDFVFIVCDNAANEVCPLWPGQPMTAYWGVPDPVRVSIGPCFRLQWRATSSPRIGSQRPHHSRIPPSPSRAR